MFSFNKPEKVIEKVYQVVEVEKPRPSLDPEFKKSVPSLAGHPGFIYLMNKLRLERARLKQTLIDARHAEMRDVEFLQSGVFWTDWLESQLQAEINLTKVKASSPATQDEFDAFRQAEELIERVGE